MTRKRIKIYLKRKKWSNKLITITLGILSTLFILSLLFNSGCAKKEKEIKIGAIFALTGDAAKYGEMAKMGLELALDEINTKGIKGRKIKIIYEDSQGDPEKAVSSFQKLVNIDKVKYIIGPMSSSEVLAIAPLAEKRKVIVLSPTASAPQITNAGDYIFRNVMSDIFDGQALAVFVYRDLKKRKAGIIYINNDFGVGLKDAFKNKFEELGGKVVIEETFERKTTDFRTQLSRIKSKEIDVLFVIGYAEMGQILRQIKEMGIKTQVISFSMFEDPNILKVAGDAAEGVYYTYRVFDLKSKELVVENFVKKFREKYGKEPDIFAALTYDAIRILAYALEKGGFDVEKCKKALYNIKDFPGVVGKTTFDKNGDVIKPIGIKMVKNGKFVWVNKNFTF